MKKMIVFNLVTVDGFFAGPNGELDWFKLIKKDDGYDEYTHEQSKSGGTLIFGHTTYEMMKSYWSTPGAIKNGPDMAGVMNSIQKIVFSKTLEGVEWKNTELAREIIPEEILKMKEQRGRDMLIVGSANIVQRFTNLGLIDEYRLLVHPVILGRGTLV